MRCLVCCVALAAASPVHAEDAITATGEAPRPHRHLVYAELLGKGGAYGIGYEYTVMPWLAFGAAVSYAVIGDERLATAAPYVHVPLLGNGPNQLFGELGAILAHRQIPSPVPEWDGMTRTGTAAFLSLGYERSISRFVIRASGSVVAGDGGFGPMAGIAIGARP